MEHIGETTRRIVDSRTGEILPNSTQKSSDEWTSTEPSARPKDRSTTSEIYHCFICKDMGWVYHDHPVGHKEFGKAFRCSCQFGQDEARRRNYLLRIDGLSPNERVLQFSDLSGGNNQSAIHQVQNATQQRKGIITLTGKPGTGKSSMLICAVNATRNANVPAVYTTITDLLDYLRQAYAPNTELSFDARWDLLIRAEVLALDELDEFNTTPWAMERFLRLIDERWRAMDRCLTLCATNSSINGLPDKIASRLRDGRAYTFELSGGDMRPYQRW
jgi:DNA replication protein DnaC